MRPFGNDRSQPNRLFGRFLSYSRAEKRGLVFLLLLILLLLALPEVIGLFLPQPVLRLSIQSQRATDSIDVKTSVHQSAANENHALHEFDPNQVSPETLMSFGVPQPVARRMKNYRDKGGRFRKPEDLLRIWGMDTFLYEKLKPFMRMPEKSGAVYSEYVGIVGDKSKRNMAVKLVAIDINTADSSVLVMLPGIGEKLAARIVAYREKLGGFAHFDQLFEVYGLPRETVIQLREQGNLGLISGVYRKIQINTCKAAAMKHPYITKTQVNALLAYRQQHGPFKDSSDLHSVLSFSAAEKTRLIPYLDFTRN